MIPLIFHFAYFRGKTNWAWRDFHTVCLQTCKGRAGPEKIVVHYDRDGEGSDWEAARDIPGIEWRQVTPASTINGYPVKDQRLWCDIYRLDTLDKEGGFFCDLDFIFLKSFEEIRRTVAVIGTQCIQKKKLNIAVLGSVPGSAFIQAFKAEYAKWTPDQEKHTWTYANTVPWELSLKYPVTVLKRNAFYPVTWSNKSFWNGEEFSFENSFAVHLWEHLHPELCVPQLMETCLGDTIQAVCDPKPTVTVLAGKSISFD